MSHQNQIFDRLTKGDSYFLHQIRKNRRKQYTKRRNHSPYTLQNGKTDPQKRKEKLPMISGQEMREDDDSVLIESPANSENGEFLEGNIMVGGEDQLDNFLDNLRNQNSTRQRLEQEREMQWKKQLAEAKERSEEWNSKLKERIAQVDKLKEEIRLQQQKHEEQLLEERQKLDKEYTTKHNHLAERETSLFALMEDIKVKLEQQSQAEKMLTLRFADLEMREKHADRREEEYKAKIEELNDTISRQEIVIANSEKQIQEQTEELDKSAERDKQYIKIEKKLEQVELELHRATVEREKYATEKEIKLNKREESLQAFETEVQQLRKKTEEKAEELRQQKLQQEETIMNIKKELKNQEQELVNAKETLALEKENMEKAMKIEKETFEKEIHEERIKFEEETKKKEASIVTLKQEIQHKLQVAEEQHKEEMQSIEQKYKKEMEIAKQKHEEALTAENEAKAALVASNQDAQEEMNQKIEALEKSYSQKLSQQKRQIDSIREELADQQKQTEEAVEEARRQALFAGSKQQVGFEASHHDLKLHKANVMADLARKKNKKLIAARELQERKPDMVEEEEATVEEEYLMMIANGSFIQAIRRNEEALGGGDTRSTSSNTQSSVTQYSQSSNQQSAKPTLVGSTNASGRTGNQIVGNSNLVRSDSISQRKHIGGGAIMTDDEPQEGGVAMPESPFESEVQNNRYAALEPSHQRKTTSSPLSEVNRVGSDPFSVMQSKVSQSSIKAVPNIDEIHHTELERHLSTAAMIAGYTEKRITYISVMAGSLLQDRTVSDNEPYDPRSLDKEPNEVVLAELIKQSGEYNRENGITSILVTVKNMFIQVIEGETSLIDATFGRIYKSALHEHIQVVRIEESIEERLYSESYLNYVPIRDPAASAFMNTLVKLKYDQDVIEQYICPPVLAQIKNMKNPLEAPVLRYRRVVLITRIHRFADMEVAIGSDLEEHSRILNQYFNLVSRSVQDAGGQVVSFRNDEIVCYFKEDDIMLAYETALMILYRIHRCHTKLSVKELNNLKHVQIVASLVYGGTVEGSFGGPVMKTFELLGESVERARAMNEYNVNVHTRSPFYLLMDENIYNVARTHPECGKNVGFVKNKIYQVAASLMEEASIEKDKKKKKKKNRVEPASLSSDQLAIKTLLQGCDNRSSFKLLSKVPQFYVTTQYRKRRAICQFQLAIDEAIDSYIDEQLKLTASKPALELHTQHGDAYSGGLSPSQLNARKIDTKKSTSPSIFQEYITESPSKSSVQSFSPNSPLNEPSLVEN